MVCNHIRSNRISADMQSVTEQPRQASPAGHPQPLAAIADTLYVGAWDTDAIYPIETKTWTAGAAVAAPGKPYGMAVLDGAIRVVVSVGADDDRYLYAYTPGKGFDPNGIALPDLSGSHLASDGTTLYLLQMGNRKIVSLDGNGAVTAEHPLPARLAGIGFANGALYGITGDEEFENLHFARIDLSGPEAVVTPIASIDDEARGLTFDGNAWWTSYRDVDTIGSFAP
jgi:hypothetical protein